MILILVLTFLLPGEKVNAQPTQSNVSAKQQQTNSQPSVTPLTNPQIQIDDSVKTASPTQSQQRDTKDEAFRTEQLRQNRIIAKATVYIAIFGGLSFFAALIYAIVSIKQWKAIDIQATHAGEQVKVMKDTLAETRRIFDLTERPIIVAESANIPNLVPSERVSPVVMFANKGRTAAQKFKVTTEIAGKPGYVWAFGFGDTGVHPQGDWFLGAGDKMTIEGAPASAVSLDENFYRDIMDGKEALMIHGKGSYEDLAGRVYPIEYAFHHHPKHGFTSYPIRKWGESDQDKERNPNYVTTECETHEPNG